MRSLRSLSLDWGWDHILGYLRGQEYRWESWQNFALLATQLWNLLKLAYRCDLIVWLVLYMSFLIQDASHKNKLSFC
jgi:hypothetical protein